MRAYRFGMGSIVALAAACSAHGTEQSLNSETLDDRAEVQRAEGGATKDVATISDMTVARTAAVASIVGDEMAQRLASFGANKVVWSLDLPDGNTVTWRELHEGIVAISVLGPSMPSVPEEAVRAVTAVEVFEAFMPGAPIPNALTELSERQAEMAPVYSALAEATDAFPEFRHAPDWAPDAEVNEQTEIGSSVEELGGEFSQVGSALDAQSCFDQANGTCGASGTASNWTVSRKNLTTASSSALRKIERTDQIIVMGIGCGQVGQVQYSIEFYDWWGSGWETWLDTSLPTGPGFFTFNGVWRLQLEDYEDFDVRIKMFDFSGSDMGSHCAYGYND